MPSPVGNGWRMSEGQLETHWMTRNSAPDSLLEYVSCKCKTACKTLRCSCVKSSLKCTDVCGCSDCCNGHDKEQEENGEEESSDLSDCSEDGGGRMRLFIIINNRLMYVYIYTYVYRESQKKVTL